MFLEDIKIKYLVEPIQVPLSTISILNRIVGRPRSDNIRRMSKKRKFSHKLLPGGTDEVAGIHSTENGISVGADSSGINDGTTDEENTNSIIEDFGVTDSTSKSVFNTTSEDFSRRGVIYFPELPPYVGPATLKNRFSCFGKITRMHCTRNGMTVLCGPFHNIWQTLRLLSFNKQGQDQEFVHTKRLGLNLKTNLLPRE